MDKKVYFIYCLILVLILSTSLSLAFDKNNIPDMIRIGLKYGDKSVSVVNLKSTSGFEFGYYDDNEFYCLFNLMDVTDIIIKKDEYYKVQIGGTFPTKEEMENFINSLGNMSCYSVYDNGWKVWTELFSSKNEAEEFIVNNGKIGNKKLQVVNPNNVNVVVSDKSGKVLFTYNSSEKEYNFRPFLDKDGNDIIYVDGKRYRDEIIIKRYSNSDMTVINYLSLDKYLYGVLPKEMSGDWPLEALKAQAVAARSYAVSNLQKHRDYGFDLCSTIDCQVYGGYDVEKPRSNLAVDQTTKKIITYNGKIISPFYHSNSGGHTENSENIWSISLPYIRGVKDDFSLGAPNSNWTKVYTPQEIKSILISKGFKIGDITAIYPESYSDNGRVLSLRIKDDSEGITLIKEKTRAVFGYYDIKSMCFTVGTDIDFFIMSNDTNSIRKKPINNLSIMTANGITKTSTDKKYKIFNGEDYIMSSGIPTKYIFEGKGWGHGLGMSQWGAKKMAELGYNYEDILKHYYTGINIE